MVADTAVDTATLEMRDLHASVEGKKILKLAVREPEIPILDETHSGLHIDSLREVATGISQLAGPELGVLVITHYQRILNYITPDQVHVMIGGRIVKSGGPEIAHELEEKGYEGIRGELGIAEEGAEERWQSLRARRGAGRRRATSIGSTK